MAATELHTGDGENAVQIQTMHQPGMSASCVPSDGVHRAKFFTAYLSLKTADLIWSLQQPAKNVVGVLPYAYVRALCEAHMQQFLAQGNPGFVYRSLCMEISFLQFNVSPCPCCNRNQIACDVAGNKKSHLTQTFLTFSGWQVTRKLKSTFMGNIGKLISTVVMLRVYMFQLTGLAIKLKLSPIVTSR